MKKIILIPVLLFVLIGCTKSTNEEISNNLNIVAILGKWQLIENLDYNPPGPYIITNGPIIEINADGTFISNEFTGYPNGTYTFSAENIIDLKYLSNTDFFIKQKKIKSYTSTELILDNDLSPNGVIGCTEGCAERYSKVNVVTLNN